MKEPIDTGNYLGVASGGSAGIVVMCPKLQLTKAQALLHAAWLVALADESVDNVDFKAVLAAVQNA